MMKPVMRTIDHRLDEKEDIESNLIDDGASTMSCPCLGAARSAMDGMRSSAACWSTGTSSAPTMAREEL
jgi:hypothetical protein